MTTASSYTGSRANPYNGSPGATNSGSQASPIGELAFDVTDNSARLANMTLANYKYGVRQASANASINDVQVSNITGTNFYRFWDTTEGQETYGAMLQNVSITGFERAFARWFSVYGTADNYALIDGCFGDGGGDFGEPYQEGIHLEGQCQYVRIQNTTMQNCSGPTGDYTNGDGFADEGNNYHIIYGPNLKSLHNGDGGYDVKSNPTFIGTPTTGGEIYAEDCHRDWRLWNGCDASAATFHSKATRGEVLWFNGLNSTGGITTLPVAVIGKLIAEDPAAGATSIIRFENGDADVTINDYDIYKGWRGLPLKSVGASGTSAVKFPNGGRVQQDDGTWISYAGAPPTGTGGVIL